MSNLGTSQRAPKTKTCQIAIADTGVGYLKSYRNTAYEVTSHKEAIANAVKGNSSKDDIERGAGIPGMIKIFCEGYGGDSHNVRRRSTLPEPR